MKNRVYRICPCDPLDIEALQSWLEDLSGQGLILCPEGRVGALFAFTRQEPQRLRYRLDVAQKKKGRFFSTDRELTQEEQELYRELGWEYCLTWKELRIYRAASPDAGEMNSEPQTHAITIGFLRQKQRSNLVAMVILALFWLIHTGSALRYSFLSAIFAGPVFLLCGYGILLYLTVAAAADWLRLRRYEKLLKGGQPLNRYCPWRRRAVWHFTNRFILLALVTGLLITLIGALAAQNPQIPAQQLPDMPFVTAGEIFPDSRVTESVDYLDYGSGNQWDNSVAESFQWRESCDLVTGDGKAYFAILRVDYHRTAAPWIAQGLEEDYFVYDSTRRAGRRFRELTPPQTQLDSLRVYESYGSVIVLIRHGNQVIHAVVHLSDSAGQNQWEHWVLAMARTLTS